MPVTQARPKTKSASASTPSTGGGGFGGNLSSWKGFGDGQGGNYGKPIESTKSVGGPKTDVLRKFQSETGVRDLYSPGLISSQVAGKAATFGKTHAPRYVENAEKYFAGLKQSSDADLQIKTLAIGAAMHHSRNLVNQHGQDHRYIQHQMNATVAMAATQWETSEQYLTSQGELQMLAKQAAGY